METVEDLSKGVIYVMRVMKSKLESLTLTQSQSHNHINVSVKPADAQTSQSFIQQW